MSMTLEQLVELYILQKEYHNKNAELKKQFEKTFQNVMTEYEVDIQDKIALPLASRSDQPSIPFVLYKPKIANAKTPQPLIIHTHGGPHVYMDKSKPHAEIAYYLSHGYVVACPNYRGSKFPDQQQHPEGWAEWINKSKDKHHLLGCDDVYAVADYMRQMSFIKKDKLFLRGMSFGSHINSHLLQLIQDGQYENIFSGAQFSGGIKYPIPTTMPTTIPLLISHAIQDEIANYGEAKIFMEKLLLQQMQTREQTTNLQIFISKAGNHHLIDPVLTIQDTHSDSYRELHDYLSLSTRFIHEITQTNTFIAEKADKQLQTLKYGSAESKEHVESIQQLASVHAYVMNQHDNTGELASDQAKIKAAALITQNDNNSDDEPEEEKQSGAIQEPLMSPTMAHLKLILGDKYTGELRLDLPEFLQTHFAPVDWLSPTHNIIATAGRDMLKDSQFMQQILSVIEEETHHLQDHQDEMVLYHAAEYGALQLYSLITLWKKILKGDFSSSVDVINEMRFFDFMTMTFDDIDVFLTRMREQRDRLERQHREKTLSPMELWRIEQGLDEDEDEDEYEHNNRPSLNPVHLLNNIPGFSDRALACNPALTTNQHTTASCTLWWYFESIKTSKIEVPIEKVTTEILIATGIYSEARASRYKQLFEREKNTLDQHGQPQGVLQQFFVPYDLADQKAYMCQIWGEEFNKNTLNLARPSTLKKFCADPILFEARLASNAKAFSNYGNYQGFGAPDFKYANLLQARYLHQSNPRIRIKSYFRHPAAHHQFAHRLFQLVREDFTDYVIQGASIPRGVVMQAEPVRLALKQKFQIADTSEVVDDVLLLQQKELYKGLVQNPTQELYGDIVTVSRERKFNIQKRLSEIRFFVPKVYLYSLCIYLQGYTYYDLLKAAAEKTMLQHPTTDARVKAMIEETYQFLMDYINKFSVPKAAETVPMSGNTYQQLRQIVSQYLEKFTYEDIGPVEFFQEKGRGSYDSNLFHHELRSAINAFLTNARLAKEFGYGHYNAESLRQKIS